MNTLPEITAQTTLGKLLEMLCLEAGQKKPNKTPTPKNLRITAVPVAKMLDCIVYDNGFAYYTDQGISATNTKHRDGFNRMIADALDGKIDLIVTKSVSRFARNTVDSLTTVRKLKEKGVEVYFEKESIYTLDSKGELFITIMSSLARRNHDPFLKM